MRPLIRVRDWMAGPEPTHVTNANARKVQLMARTEWSPDLASEAAAMV